MVTDNDKGVSRRAAMIGAAGLTAAAVVPVRAAATPPLAADDEAGWARIAAQYPVTRAITQLENAYWGSMATPVQGAHRAILEKLNRDNSWYARRAMVKDQAAARERAAAAMGVEPEEMAFCRNAAEGLSALISQFRDVGPGDRILYSDTDYESTQGAMVSLARSRGAEAVKIRLPRSVTHDNVIAAYAAAIAATPKLKLVLLTHMSHRAGLVLPVAAIVPLARARGAQVIVDAAQSFYQFDFKLPDFGADFVGMNFHKWVGAPVGVAGIWIRKGHTDAIAPSPAEPNAPVTSVEARVHQGTVDYAAQLTVPAALDFQRTIGNPAKLARLQYLRNRWVAPLRGQDGLEILLPDDVRLHGATTSFRIRGRTSVADNIAITDALLDRFGIMTVYRSGLSDGACVRVTPSLFTTPAEVDRIVPALRTLASELAR
ncbi:aminotransferase class V-fold PLP-dependent enzyme [Polymorphobacter fuscus]|uniref:Aminotransferase class V-fold PLP-dependent enzyme n=1 Tax=Sandarakinorhabdus fusca TaxID=1439888 RepID=A0A7C9KGP5_9SPHN|nr:aminotransferase class V-fold PLP-dependent enzyme [Polymorphobacter fuscus]KAB7648215.1 aminotransferase class V-fold PLP-dependent enzyme [Polymorphobacter fuscus]MQT15719.1 aminotransferase class V-fold PLP-dependent enzyme [Polymorphobacter fuscus]NJC08010.1 selenocysteine lyase/cysteine desulfurase [Polymorphobacter fuscus]